MRLPRLRTVVRAVAITAALIVMLFAITLSLPVEAWRTGEPPAEPLSLAPGQPFGERPLRLWIDTDAACGHSRRTDPDDCFALLLLAHSPAVEIVGISTVAGNAPLDVTDRTTRALVAELAASGAGPAPVYRGPAAPPAIRAALENGPLTILALGPLTNVAAALKEHPELRANVTRVVAVMGRRKGHLFHPVEGGTAGSMFGHGPVFRDFNFSQNPAAVTTVLELGLPLTFVPYEAAREVTLPAADLQRIAGGGRAAAWVVQRARGWLDYWREDIGREGFYPFDLLAAVYLVHPNLLRCAKVTAWVGRDMGLLGWLGRDGLFIEPQGQPAPESRTSGTALYCPDLALGTYEWMVQSLARGVAA